MGIDPGFGRMGYGVLEESGRDQFRVVAYGCVETRAGEAFALRLLAIEKECKKLLKKFTPDVIAIEQLFFTKNITTGINVSHARGVILLVCAHTRAQIREFNPRQIKQTITGYGSADKMQMRKMVQMLLQMKEMPKSDDAADALAVALCGFLYR